MKKYIENRTDLCYNIYESKNIVSHPACLLIITKEKVEMRNFDDEE